MTIYTDVDYAIFYTKSVFAIENFIKSHGRLFFTYFVIFLFFTYFCDFYTN